MNKKNFEMLLGSMREGAQILRGERTPTRQFEVSKKEDVRFVRQTFHASQGAFAKIMGVSVSTLRNWEQGRRRPTGAARVLLKIALRQPDLFRAAVQEDCPELAFK
ncbi:MAG: helix-turn-helix domain-containing protein [Kiritimatiellae bacterium]|nr:helix-turn-helix domain-containing protein [Kiritimatiellia bacterium]